MTSMFWGYLILWIPIFLRTLALCLIEGWHSVAWEDELGIYSSYSIKKYFFKFVFDSYEKVWKIQTLIFWYKGSFIPYHLHFHMTLCLGDWWRRVAREVADAVPTLGFFNGRAKTRSCFFEVLLDPILWIIKYS